MLKRGLLTAFAVLLFISLVVRPTAGYAGTLDDIDRELAKIKQQAADLEQKKSAADKQKVDVKNQKAQEQLKLDDIRKQLAEQGAKLNELTLQLNDSVAQLKETATQLDEAQARVESRDKMLKSRVKLMYMSGTVSYLDVIFSATSFSDFLDRYYALKTIVGQDKDILDANKKDRDLVAEKKKQKEEQLAQISVMVAQQEEIKQQLSVQEKQKQVAIASLSKKEQDADDISEDAEAQILALARQSQKLIQQRKTEEAKNGKPQATFAYSGGKLAWPVPSSTRISDTFGMRLDPIKKVNKLHKGVDIAAPAGTTIVAAEDGVVLISGWVSGYGNTVVIDHGNGVWTWYGHIRDGGLKVSVGDTVKRGQKIAEVGSTGDSTGNHCHFEVRINEVATDPMPYLK